MKSWYLSFLIVVLVLYIVDFLRHRIGNYRITHDIIRDRA